MKSIYSVAVAAALLLSAAAVGEARSASSPSEAKAKIMLEDVDAWVASIESAADHLGTVEMRDPQGYTGEVNGLREDVNSIGREIKSLQAERASLAPWEASALDEVMPKLQVIAARVERSIQIFNSGRDRLWTTPYRTEMATIFNDAHAVRESLDANLKLASVRQREERLEAKVHQQSGTN